MSTEENYRKALDSVGDAIRVARELFANNNELLQRTYALALEKRAVEKQLRAAGYSKAGAAREVRRIFHIEKLHDN